MSRSRTAVRAPAPAPVLGCVSLLSRGGACVAAGLTASHPDPDRFHLDIVAAVARLYLGLDGKHKGSEGSPLAAAFKKAGRSSGTWLGKDLDFALFWDFARRATERAASR